MVRLQVFLPIQSVSRVSDRHFSVTVFLAASFSVFLLPPSRHHLSNGDCLVDWRENYENCSGLCCV